MEKFLPFKSIFLFINASFRRRHVFFVIKALSKKRLSKGNNFSTITMTDSENNIHAVILRQHGREVLKNLPAAENTSLKIANWSNHRIFNIRCLRAGITPSSIKLNSPIRGVKAETILRKAEKRLLDLRVRHCSYTIAKLKDD